MPICSSGIGSFVSLLITWPACLSVRGLDRTCWLNFPDSQGVTYSNTCWLNGFWRFPRYSPIICLLSPFLVIRKWATSDGVSPIKPWSHRNTIPFSGFLQVLNISIHVCFITTLCLLIYIHSTMKHRPCWLIIHRIVHAENFNQELYGFYVLSTRWYQNIAMLHSD